jgi:hypothetical protein
MNGRERSVMPRAWIWLQVVLGWLPVWALYTALIVYEHAPTSAAHAALLALESVIPAAVLGVAVYRFTRRLAWPRPFRPGFLAIHLAAAVAYGFAWIGATSLVTSIISWRLSVVIGPGLVPFLVLGIWLYMIVAGVSYANEATKRAANAEAESARAQLAALRAQLHPHFVFNALHTVVHLIPDQPARAAQAAEEVAHLLRATIEDDRDIVTLADEWGFVERYLSLERLRFGDRLVVHVELPPAATSAELPSFALQTLVENAVRHGAAPRTEPTTIIIRATLTARQLTIEVSDAGAGATADQIARSQGSGIRRLRSRLRALYGDAATLHVTGIPGRGVTGTLGIPQREAES